MKILAFAGSNSKKSINKQLVEYVSKNHLNEHEVKVIDLNDFEVPLYSIDREKANGIPAKIQEFVNMIEGFDALVVSLAEHNGAYTVAFKNLIDWSSRHELKFFAGKPMILMATSPGGYGGKNVLAIAEDRLSKFDASIEAVFSLPKFNDNFHKDKGIVDKEKREELEKALLKIF